MNEKEDKYISESFSGGISQYMGLVRRGKYIANNYFDEWSVNFRICFEVSVEVFRYILQVNFCI